MPNSHVDTYMEKPKCICFTLGSDITTTVLYVLFILMCLLQSHLVPKMQGLLKMKHLLFCVIEIPQNSCTISHKC